MSAKFTLVTLVTLLGLVWLRPAQAQPGAVVRNQKARHYTVDLRMPPAGLYAREETDIEFHVGDASQDDPIQGPAPVVKAKVNACVTMPTMASMPAQNPKIHSEGVPGDYGVVVFFAHGGDYKLDLTITPLNDKPFTVSFKIPVNDASAARKPQPQPFTLEVTPQPGVVSAGNPTNLTIVIRSRETRMPVTEFDTTHERKMHFVIVSQDLRSFAHEHPYLHPDGTFTLRYTFPAGGVYHLFADVAPHEAGDQILMQALSVTGPGSTSPLPVNKAGLEDRVGGVKVTLKSAENLTANRTLPLLFTLKDEQTGAPITDLEPYLGAMAHLIMIHQDAVTYVHSHPDETDPANGKHGALTFLARFPRPGTYRVWLQFQRAGQVQTATLTVIVKAGEGAR